MELEEERDTCRGCGELLDVEYLIVTECDDILCSACTAYHDCSICFPSDADSDSDYNPVDDVGEESSTTQSSETVEESSSEQES
jgi:hypothetical protein